MTFLKEKEISLIRKKYQNSEEVMQDLLYLNNTYAGFDEVKEWVLSSNNEEYVSKALKYLANLSYHILGTDKKTGILDNAYNELRKREGTNNLSLWFMPYIREAYQTGTVKSLSK